MKPALIIILTLVTALSATAKPIEPAATSPIADPITREPLQLLYFTASWCGPCQLMKSQTWPDTRVKAALKNYTFRTIDIDQEPKIAEQLGVRSMPSYIIADPSGQQELTRMSGFMDADRMTVWLSEVYDTAYTNLEAQRAALIAFEKEWTALEPLFDDPISPENLSRAQQALYKLLARRDSTDSESTAKLERALSSLTQAYPDRLIDGLLHQDLQVRVKIARALRDDGLTLNPWAPLEQRQIAVQVYRDSIHSNTHN